MPTLGELGQGRDGVEDALCDNRGAAGIVQSNVGAKVFEVIES